MNKCLKFIAGCALSLSLINPVSALTTHKPSDWVPNGDKGSTSIVDENITNLNGASNYGPYSKASKEKLNDGITEETYVDLNFDNIKDGEFFEVTLGLQNAKNEYVTEAVVMSQRVGDKIVLTAGWAPEFKAEVTKSGIYTYRWDMYVKSDGIAYVVFTILEGDKTIGSTGEVSLDSEEAKGPDTKSPVAEQEDVSVKYLWFCNIQVEKGINVYSKLPGLAQAEVNDTAENGLALGNIEKLNDIIRASLANLHFDNVDANTAYEVNIDSHDIKATDEKAEQFNKALAEKTANGIIAKYFDISLIVKDAMNDKELGKLTNLTDKIELIINIPEDLPEVEEGYQRVFYIIRDHDDGADVLPTVVSEEDKTISFESDLFSTYALAYEDIAVSQAPNTGDNVAMFLSIGTLALLETAIIGFSIKKKREN